MTRSLPSNRFATLLGEEFPRFGHVERRVLAERTSACALSAGATALTPALASKGDPAAPNEDALHVRDEGRRVMLAVADAHHGLESSHLLINSIAGFESIPPDLDSLELELARCCPDPPTSRSATTLVVAVLDRDRRTGFGVSAGDSSVVLVGEGGARRVNTRNEHYLRPWDPGFLSPGQSAAFHFRAGVAQLLLAFTDGIDECHYRSSQTSVNLPHLAEIYQEVHDDAEQYCSRLMALALEGVEGNPGGQDNIALVVTRVALP